MDGKNFQKCAKDGDKVTKPNTRKTKSGLNYGNSYSRLFRSFIEASEIVNKVKFGIPECAEKSDKYVKLWQRNGQKHQIFQES